MVDYTSLRKKFPAKDPEAQARRAKTQVAVKRIAREFDRKRAELNLRETSMKRPLVYYLFIIVILLVLGGSLLSVATGKVSWGKKKISKAAIQSRQSIDALAVACGRYKFHVGHYPTTEEGLAELARIPATSAETRELAAKGWFGPYIKKVVPDPWGNDYVYEAREEGGHPVLYSKGPDGRAGTTDDVLPEQSLFDEPFRDTTWTNHWVPYQLRGIVVAPNEAEKRKIEEEVRKF